MNQSRNHWLLLSLLLFAFLLRALELGGRSLWLEEAFAVWNAERSPAEIWSEPNDNHPPTYYLMLHQWIKVSQEESWLRLPSVFASMLALSLTYALSRRLLGRHTAWMAASLLAVAPLSIWYAQETRMVIFVAPFALLIGLGLVNGGWRGGLLIFLGLTGGLYFDYTILPLWVILSGLWLFHWWQHGRSRNQLFIWVSASLLGWLAFLPLWWHLAKVIGRLGNIFVIANIREQLGLSDLGGLIYLLGLLGLGAVTIAAGWLWQKLVERPLLCQLLTISILVGFIALTLFTPFPRLYSVKRVLVTGWPLIIILAAMLFNWLEPRYQWLWKGAAVVSLTAALITLLFVPKDDWRSAVGYINANIQSGDVVWLAPASGQNPYNYYQPKAPPMVGSNLILEPPPVEIWHIAERQPGNPTPNGPIEAWLDENRPLLEVVPFYRLEVRHYGSSTQ
jgi:uncharacterized membrane protein